MKPAFNRRKATSFALLFSFLIMLSSGVMLWIFPRIASFGGAAEFGGFSRPVWLNQHIVFGILFALLSLYHLFGVNREPFFSYLKKSANNGGPRRPEFLATALATALIAVLTALHVPAVSGNLRTSDETASTFERRGNWNPADEQSEDFKEHSRHHHFHDDHDDFDGRRASPQIADRRDADGTSDEAGFSAEFRNASRMMSNEAPDDELHRRTTASCASCH